MICGRFNLRLGSIIYETYLADDIFVETGSENFIRTAVSGTVLVTD